MTRATRHLAALALAGTVATGSLLVGTPAFAGGDNLVDISRNNVVLYNDIPITTAANLCGVSVNVVSAVDDSGQKTECKALSVASTKAWIQQN